MENNFNAIQTTLNDFRTELSRLKEYQLTVEYELTSIREKLVKLETASMAASQSNNPDFFFTKIKDRISREKNIVLFNVSDSEITIPLATSSDLLRDLSLPSINIIRAKYLGNIGLKPRVI